MAESIVSIGACAVVSAHIAVTDGKPTTTTRDIAEVFGKRHDNVLQIVHARMAEAGAWGLLNFQEVFVEVEAGNGAKVSYPVIRMTEKGFMFVVQKFTGKKAVHMQIAYVDEFERMRDALAPAAPALPYTAQPQDKLSAGEQDILRDMLTSAVKRLPPARQAGAMIKGWSKLKSHFGVNYRQIPAEPFTEALSIVARHITEWELLDTPKPYHFPLELADPHDRQLLSAHLTARVLTDPRNRAPELELLAQLEANGHDVTGAKVRITAMHRVLGMAESRRQDLLQLQALLARAQDTCKQGLAEFGMPVQFAGLPGYTTSNRLKG